jgi:hypothetical protein
MVAPRIIALSLVICIIELNRFDEEMELIDDELTYLSAFSMALSGTVAVMTTMHGYRKLFGTPHILQKGKYESTLEMMDKNPHQFYQLFRMSPHTCRLFREKLWNHMYPPNRRRMGRPPDWDVFNRRLLMTTHFLASGMSYASLEFTWGFHVDWGELLIAEIASMIDDVVKWPVGDNMLSVCHGFERMRGFKGVCGYAASLCVVPMSAHLPT